MPIYFEKICEENIKKYGTEVNVYGPVLLANLYADKTHFIYELLQNAEDAGAKYIKFDLYKNRLEITHNGRLFNEADVMGICGIVAGTKKDDLNKIGKFGIGFKSVYAYSNSPTVISGEEAFTIYNFVMPKKENKSIKIEPEQTIFIIPFNNDIVKPETAFKEISEKIKNLELNVLLFIKNLNEISWSIEDGISGKYSKTINSEKINRVNLKQSSNDNKINRNEDWIIFEKKLPNGTSRVEVGYKYAKEYSRNKQIETIIPIDKHEAFLSVYFPTKKSTGLNFLIQGPYHTLPNREDIHNDDDHNTNLIIETSKLVCESIKTLKDEKMLDYNFLSILPIGQNGAGSIFNYFYTDINNVFNSDEKILPAYDGGYLSARESKIPYSKSLIELIESSLCSSQKYNWLNLDINKSDYIGLKKYLMTRINVQEFGHKNFSDLFTEKYLSVQNDDWLIKLYKLISENKTSEVHYINKPIIRLEDGRNVTVYNSFKKPNAYLPKDGISLYANVVKKSIVYDKDALSFLKELGFYEPDELSEINDIILPKYNNNYNIDIKENLIHIEKISSCYEKFKNNNSKCYELINGIQGLKLFLSNTLSGNQKGFRTAKEIFEKNEFNSIYFENNEKAFFLDAVYDEIYPKIKTLISVIGLKKEPSIKDNNAFDIFLSENIKINNAEKFWNFLIKNYSVIYGDNAIIDKLNSFSWIPIENILKSPKDIESSQFPENLDKTTLGAKTIISILKFKNEKFKKALQLMDDEDRAKCNLISSLNKEELEEALKQYKKIKGKEVRDPNLTDRIKDTSIQSADNIISSEFKSLFNPKTSKIKSKKICGLKNNMKPAIVLQSSDDNDRADDFSDYLIDNSEDSSTNEKGKIKKIHPETFKQIGELAEKIVLCYLNNKILEECPGSISDYVYGKSKICIKQNEKTIATISALNATHENASGRDIEIVYADNRKVFIEVKTGKWIMPSSTQWQYAKMHGDNYYIFKVKDIKSIDPEVIEIQNPYMDLKDVLGNPYEKWDNDDFSILPKFML